MEEAVNSNHLNRKQQQKKKMSESYKKKSEPTKEKQKKKEKETLTLLDCWWILFPLMMILYSYFVSYSVYRYFIWYTAIVCGIFCCRSNTNNVFVYSFVFCCGKSEFFHHFLLVIWYGDNWKREYNEQPTKNREKKKDVILKWK